MKNLRKWIALAAAMAMTATLLTGCGSSEAPASEAAASTADNSTAVATAPAETTAAEDRHSESPVCTDEDHTIR